MITSLLCHVPECVVGEAGCPHMCPQAFVALVVIHRRGAWVGGVWGARGGVGESNTVLLMREYVEVLMRTMTDCETMYGPRGWTREADLASVLGSVPLPIDHDPNFWRFEDASADQVRRLLDSIPTANLDDQQNWAPTCGALLKACVSHPASVTLSGYVVGPGRWDERVTFDGVRIAVCPVMPGSAGFCREPVGQDRVRVWRELGEYLGLDACEANMPDEMLPLAVSCGLEGCGWWLWWD